MTKMSSKIVYHLQICDAISYGASAVGNALPIGDVLKIAKGTSKAMAKILIGDTHGTMLFPFPVISV